MRRNTSGWIVVFLGMLIGLSGCTPKKQVALELPAYGPHYCYKSLAEPDCYAEPLPEGERTPIGWYEAPSGTQSIDSEINCYRLFFVKELCPDE